MKDRAELYKEAVRALRHDARNLLNGVAIMAEYFAESDDKKSQQFAQYLDDKVTAMVRLGERADMIANIGPATMDIHEVNELMDLAYDRLNTDRPKPAFEFGQLALRGDGDLATMAISEVLDNALATGTEVSVVAAENDGFVTVIIADQGTGVPEPAMPMLMMPYRGAKRPGGSSLGLPMAKAAMEAQGGSLDLQTKDGEGTAVSLHFQKA